MSPNDKMDFFADLKVNTKHTIYLDNYSVLVLCFGVFLLARLLTHSLVRLVSLNFFMFKNKTEKTTKLVTATYTIAFSTSLTRKNIDF